MTKHFTIPIFIPEKACPFRCIYCNQYRISSTVSQPSEQSIVDTIETYLKTLPNNAEKEIGFFGGSFTGMTIDEQNVFLKLAFPYLQKGLVSGIRLSTRPDYITSEILENLKSYGVKVIEIGGQSLHEDVLLTSNRGHTLQDVEKASQMILSYGFELGIQMMIGLPGDTMERAIATAKKIIELGASNTRIYPAIVIKDTVLADMFLKDKYKPLTIEEAVLWTKEIIKIFEEGKVNILRVGLHPTEGLIHGSDMLAGPFHVSFKELVMTEIWNDILKNGIKEQQGNGVEIVVNPKQLNAAIGYYGKNKKMIMQQYKQVLFSLDENLDTFECKILNF